MVFHHRSIVRKVLALRHFENGHSPRRACIYLDTGYGSPMDSVDETGWEPTPQGGATHNGCHAMLVGGSHLTKIMM
jgi:hypothetical protein